MMRGFDLPISELRSKERKAMTCFDPMVNVEAEMLKIIEWLGCSQSPHQTCCITYDQLEYNSKDDHYEI